MDNAGVNHAYLEAPPCLRPLGFDPMLNVLSLPDAVDALHRAVRAFGHQGVFNIPGADSLPLSECLRRWGRQVALVITSGAQSERFVIEEAAIDGVLQAIGALQPAG